MGIENTDLERRVLAHERVLQALIGHMAEADPSLLHRLGAAFGAQAVNRHEQDYTDTASYAEQFVRRIVDMAARPGALPMSDSPVTYAAAAVSDPEARPTTFRVARRSGIWEVTKDGAFLGHYTAEGPARAAAAEAAADVIAAGGLAVVPAAVPRGRS